MNIKPLNLKYVCFWWAVVVCLFATTITSCGPKQTACIHGADSELHQPLSGFAGEVVVFIVTSPDCPIANAMAPEMERLYQQTKTGGGRYYIVHARNDVSAKRANEHASQYGLTAPILLDRDHSLVSQFALIICMSVLAIVGTRRRSMMRVGVLKRPSMARPWIQPILRHSGVILRSLANHDSISPSDTRHLRT